jgi:RNA polymerase sigma factor (sigma-70 family)
MYTASGKSDKNFLLREHAPLVKRLAYQLKARLPPSVEVDDLVQAGMIGLLDAISRYEDTHGAQFETYAVQRIRGAMLDELQHRLVAAWGSAKYAENRKCDEPDAAKTGAAADRNRSGQVA